MNINVDVAVLDVREDKLDQELLDPRPVAELFVCESRKREPGADARAREAEGER